MSKATSYLKDLATTIGWKLVNDDKGFSTYEYEILISKYEKVSFVVRILDEPTEFEVYEILLTLIRVLPVNVKRKIEKLISKFKAEDFINLLEVAIFTIDEFKKNTDYAKLKEYGILLGVDIEEKGYNFEYRLKKNRKAEIISVIEVNLPIEIAPILGKIKKIDYKIAYLKNNKIKEAEE